MAIELNQTTNISFDSLSKSAASSVSNSTASPSFNTDVKKVAPELQEKLGLTHEISDPQKSQAIELSNDQLDAVITKLNDFVEQQQRDIRFTVDEDTNKTVVKLLDSNGDVLKQFPSEEMLSILKSIESNKGLFLEDEA